MKRSKWGPVFLFLAFLQAGTSVVAARFLTGHLGVFTITAVSLLLAILFLLTVRLKRLMQTVRKLTGKELFFLLLQAVFGIFLFRLCLFQGLMYTSSAEAGMLTSAAPAMTAIMAVVILKEKPTVQKLAGILLTLAGVLLIQRAAAGGTGFTKEHLWGNVLVICAAACEALFSILSKVFFQSGEQAQRSPMDPAVQTILVSFMAMVACMVFAAGENPLARLAVLPPSGWLALLWYGVFVTALSYICWFAGILRSSALTAAAFSAMMPFTAALLSVLILHEKLALMQIIGGVLIMGGMVWLGMGGKRIQEIPLAATGENAGDGKGI